MSTFCIRLYVSVCIFFACVESYTTITLTLGMAYPPHSDFTLYNIHFIQDNFTINLDGQLNVFFAIYMFGVCTCVKYKNYTGYS